MKKLCVLILLLFPILLISQDRDQHFNVHFYPHALLPQDILQDGPDGKNLDIKDDTFLIWVDLFPSLFFTHDTAYILISKGDIRIKRGRWWPVLNGKMILHNEHEKYAFISPFDLPLISTQNYIDEKITIYVYPHKLTSQDQLSDGPPENKIRIFDNSILIWVDLLPAAFFAHPTAYILISKRKIRTEQGNWWPMLNGKQILYGQQNKIGILSPFKVTREDAYQKRKKRN